MAISISQEIKWYKRDIKKLQKKLDKGDLTLSEIGETQERIKSLQALIIQLLEKSNV